MYPTVISGGRLAPGMQCKSAMAKKNQTRKDSKKELRPLATDDLKAVVGGASSSAPGNYGAKSSGGGGTSY